MEGPNDVHFLFCIQSQVTDIWAKLNNPNAKLPVRWELIAGFVIMVTERLVRLASKLEESEHEQADRECFDGLLLGDGDADFPGLLGLLSFGVPKDVEEQQVQSPSAQLAVWASKVSYTVQRITAIMV